MTSFIKDIKKENQQERGGVMIFLATAKGRVAIFHARPHWGVAVFQLIFSSLPPPP
jgi:hypothetical protein